MQPQLSLQIVLNCEVFYINICWTLYRTKLFVYAVVVTELLHLLAYVYSQMNHRSIYGAESYQFSTPENYHPVRIILQIAQFLILSSKMHLIENQNNETSALGIQIQPDLQTAGLIKNKYPTIFSSGNSSWTLQQPQINHTLHCSLKDNTLPETYRNKFLEICDHYKGFS